MMAKPSDATCASPDLLLRQFNDTLDTILAATKLDADVIASGFAVAYSGGLDSSALLSLAADYAAQRGIPFFAFHIHHGLSPNADDWLAHCQSTSAAFKATFDYRKVHVANDSQQGIEATARAARYRALGALCQQHQLPLILTAHHQDDQAETMLLQLLRGSGVAGLSGMDQFNKAPTLFGTDAVLLARPLLTTERKTLSDYVMQRGIRYVDDESNTNTRFARNALRHQVMPVLDQIAHGYAARLARSAQHIQAASRMLEELAHQDFIACRQSEGLDADLMRVLSRDRVNNLLRYWLSRQQVRMPSTARLEEIRRQIFDASADAMVTIEHDSLRIHRYKNLIDVERTPLPNTDADADAGADAALPVQFVWRGEACLKVPDFFGTLHFDRSEFGLPPSLLHDKELTVRLRQGGERLKLAENRPTRDMKSHYQALQIPFWKRQRLPFVVLEQRLLYAAGVGMDCGLCTAGEGNIVLRWEPQILLAGSA